MPSLPKTAVALANNDYVHIAWNFGDKPLDNCGGFAIYRIKKGGSGAQPLKAFDRDKDGNRLEKTCEDLPIRKYSWRDVFAQRDQTYKYRIVPMSGPHQPLADIEPLETEWVSVSQNNENAQAFFNRGLLATQKSADALWDPAKQKPDFAKIEALINDPKSPFRKSLMGEHFSALTQLLDRAESEGGSCWAALFELTDKALIDKLAACKDLHLILSNNNTEKTETKPMVYDGKNNAAAVALEPTCQELVRRYMPTGQIGHNKFMVYKDKKGKPRAVLTGSTNWTASGMCTQSNNAIIIESEALARIYLEYWEALKADALAAKIPEPPAAMKGIQGKTLRTDCATKRKTVKFDGGSTIQVWFSPNASGLARPPKKGVESPDPPLDLAEVYQLMENAEQSVLFLAFMPGKAESANSFHFLKQLGKISSKRPELFVRGAVSDPELTREFDLGMLRNEGNENYMISSPFNVFKNFDQWRQEIYKYGHAIIHDKLIVIDPLGKKPVVITGSHNLGFRASSNNDENMLIIRGNRGLATAYATHVMDVFEHYRSRWISGSRKKQDYNPNQDPNWQKRYFDDYRPAFAERLFWISAGKPLPPLTPSPHGDFRLERAEADDAARKKAAADRKEQKEKQKSKASAGKSPPKKKVAAAKSVPKAKSAKKAKKA
ncbi:phospholipase D-like domain-containing protein [Anatilimnocola floriformis]|uniref:phospholipase D-like domain-containing protein n=1 Tax=Anatilimnocola floriformis TaxID=2948575 RepID=UPI0020C581D3|nr:phospholipase D-like domain-containing protein [Anatilimnocola floriformis]